MWSSMQINEIDIPGCFEIIPRRLEDSRGVFVKTLHEEIFVDRGLPTDFAEEYYSKSYQNVLRGLHFQTPPHDHVKMVYCVSGTILDVIVDLRVGSPTFGQHKSFELSDVTARTLVLAKGIAHGFYTMSQEAIVMYKVSTVYAPEHDAGIVWNSLDIPWPSKAPLLSDRDKGFPAFQDFDSPFAYQKS